jgi:hypothetical protein
MPRRRPKILAMQSVSQVPGLPGAVRRDSFLSKCIQLAIARVAFDRRVETVGIKCFEPGTKSRQFPGRQLLNGLFDVFGCGHSSNITRAKRREKLVSANLTT